MDDVYVAIWAATRVQWTSVCLTVCLLRCTVPSESRVEREPEPQPDGALLEQQHEPHPLEPDPVGGLQPGARLCDALQQLDAQYWQHRTPKQHDSDTFV